MAFLADERGAITVDWVVLTSGLAGLGLAVIGVVSTSLTSPSAGIAGFLGSIEIETTFASAVEAGFAALDFSGGDTGGFSGGNLVTLPGIGDVLQLDPQSGAAASFALPPGTTEAQLEFDLYGLDTLNNEPATIMINGQVAGTVTVDNGTASFSPAGASGVTFEAFQASSGSDLNGNSDPDSLTQVRLTVSDPGASLDFSVQSGAHADVANESFAIDNVQVSAN